MHTAVKMSQANFLSEVLSSVEAIELEQINSKCPEVASAVEVSKGNVLTYLENVYVRFRERPKQNKLLANTLNQLQEEVTALINSIEHVSKKDLNAAENVIKNHVKTLEKTNFTLTFTSTICKIHNALMDIREMRRSQQYLLCMEKIRATADLINGIPEDETLIVLDELCLAVDKEKNSLLNHLTNLFKDNVILQPAENRNVIKLKNNNEIMKEVLPALYFYKTSITPLDHVTKFLWNHVFVPVVDSTTEIKTDAEDDFAKMEVITVDPNKKSSYAEVFTNIKTILKFLSANFNISLSDELSTLSYVGRDIRDNLSELIIKHCLQDTIPSTTEGLQKYKTIIEATEDLEKALVSSKIFAEDTTSILEYANNVDILFINKKCQDYLVEARALMKKDLHDLVEVGAAEEAQNTFEITLEFPRCSISKSVLDLLQLLEKILTQATSSSDVCAGRLFCTVQNICHIYVEFVPEQHKKLLQTIPQQIAVFHNNCNYISHKLTDFNATYLNKLPSLLNHNSFTDEGRRLREVAAEMFTDYVDGQIRQIEEIMREAGLLRQTLEQVEASTEKCLRQCLRQQELLRTVWQKVLPYSVYNKTVGAILNSLCNCIVSTVTKCEDISSDAAEQLVELFKMVQTRGPKLFTDPKEVSLFVGSWYKLNELVFVLNATLLDINDRWADGKGPLALQFKPNELKQLVRALFQNTERRAALLAKIHD